ncbi:AAA domain-containing protein [Flexithrix dorotheae]|uniref:AAA domain-containing protein n=1 Tax=Flexithrix dorotheae TaxID=70993 RepID=UPI00037AB504|nr:AAA domain-containing protein [Flexithrix dorotheae]
MHETLKIYQKRLTNLTAKNRSLLLLRLIKSQFIDLHDFDFLDNRPSFDLIEDLISSKKKTKLCSTIDSRDKDSNTTSHQLRNIFRTDKFIFEERGAKDLYVGYPFVHGKMLDDSLIRCPLLFFPVELKIENNSWVIAIRKDVGVSFNKTFLLAFSHYNHVNFDESFLDYDFNYSAIDSQDFRTELYNLLKNSPLELNFSQKTFEDTLTAFTNYSKADFKNQTETGELILMQEAVLGIFPEAGSYLMPDYDFLIKSERIKDLEDFFLSADELKNQPMVHDTFVGKASHEEELITPYPIDASQEKAIKAVKGGESLVIQGPPGSGKSQLICNLIVDQIAKGKNVLVVCQKKAALDVVYQRLGLKKFDDFAALIHDFKNDRKLIYEKINRQIELLERFQTENNSLDTIYLERNFLKVSREIDQIVEELDEFKSALFDIAECGISIKELYLTSDINFPTISLRREYPNFPFSNHHEVMRKIDNYATYYSKLDISSYFWANRVSFKDFQIDDQRLIIEKINSIKPYFEEVTQQVEEIISMKLELDEFDWIHHRKEDFLKLLEILEEPVVFNYFKNDLKYSNTDFLWLANMKKNTLNTFGVEGIEATVDRKEIGNVQGLLQRAKQANRQWFRKIIYNLFSKEKAKVDELIKANGLEDTRKPINTLIIKLDNRMNLEHYLSSLSDSPWLIDIPENRNLEELQKWFDLHLKAVNAKQIYNSLRNGIKYLELEEASFDEIYKKINRLLNIVQNHLLVKEDWSRFLSIKQINGILNGSIPTDKLIASLEEDFDSLCEFDKLKENLNSDENLIINRLLEDFGKLEKGRSASIYDNSIRIAWINHIEAKYPVLRSVSSEKLVQLEEKLKENINIKIDLSSEIALLKVRERTYKEVEYNRLNNMVTYRDLKHQVSKKRNIWPIRKLIQNFSHELLNLVPCWMASPESVSAVFPMEEFFDLVIFDEASQCFAERGIPAMYRGKQVVITGDDKQLAPYDLYQPRWEEEMDGETALEVDSLLDLGKQYVQQIPLLGHYRSKSLDLIDFSNQNFYQGELRLIPDYNEFLKQESAISYIKMDGVWENNINLAEAQKVVELIKSYAENNVENIGVITFNFKQQELIQDLLEEAQVNYGSELFVKNIENVQGDERDIIIFSIGYAPSPTGKFRLQFGSLNQEKGENRLNVAVTRAREKVIIVSSIYPSQLKVDDLKNEGPKLLKDYLQYALNIHEGKYSPTIKPDGNNRSEWFLKNKIQTIFGNLSLSSTLPFADLNLDKSNEIRLLLTDDNYYFQSISTKDAHGYSQITLRDKNWTYRRFYSRHFWKNKENFLSEMEKYLG